MNKWYLIKLALDVIVQACNPKLSKGRGKQHSRLAQIHWETVPQNQEKHINKNTKTKLAFQGNSERMDYP